MTQLDIYYKNLAGITIELRMDSDATVKNIKYEIKEREKIPIEQQCLIYAGQKLEDHKQLSDYKINQHDTIHMLACLI